MTDRVGQILWFDLTVTDAEKVRDFYKAVVGWESSDHDMGDYVDYDMRVTPDSPPVAGTCHRKGQNAKIPPQWMMYIVVADLNQSLEAVKAAGGRVLDVVEGSNMAIAYIQDPGGAVCALWQQVSDQT